MHTPDLASRSSTSPSPSTSTHRRIFDFYRHRLSDSAHPLYYLMLSTLFPRTSCVLRSTDWSVALAPRRPYPGLRPITAHFPRRPRKHTCLSFQSVPSTWFNTHLPPLATSSPAPKASSLRLRCGVSTASLLHLRGPMRLQCVVIPAHLRRLHIKLRHSHSLPTL